MKWRKVLGNIWFPADSPSPRLLSQIRKVSLDVLVVKEGKIGSSSVTGNKYLSAAGIAEYLNWQEGQPFNYGIFQPEMQHL